MTIELPTSRGKITALFARLIASPRAASFAIPPLPNDSDLWRVWRSHSEYPPYQHQNLGWIRHLDGRLYGATEERVGDHDWSDLKTSFLTSPRAQAIVIRIRREVREKLDNLIVGTVWIDRAYLKEIH